ncbi:hypothetical protein ACQJBY_036080 [Aegilops geniculata]
MDATQGPDPAAAAALGDWRAQLQPEARSRVVNKMLETLRKILPVSVPDELIELQEVARQFEDKIYTEATNQADYVRKISLKMVSMETNRQLAPGNAQVIPNQNNSASADSTAQTSDADEDEDYWQEEIYQMVKIMKDQYFADLSELFNKTCVKLQHVESIIPPPIPSEQYDRMKSFKTMLERILQMLQISKSIIQPAMRDKIPLYEKQIITILNCLRKVVQPQVQQ